MTAAGAPTTAHRAVLCWCGADDAFNAVLEQSSGNGVEAVRTPSAFLEAFHRDRPASVLLSGKPESEALRLLRLVSLTLTLITTPTRLPTQSVLLLATTLPAV